MMNKIIFLIKLNLKKIKKPSLKFPKYLSEILEQNNIYFNDDFLLIVKKSLIIREQLKFEFTRNLSDALQLIINAGNNLNISRNDFIIFRN